MKPIESFLDRVICGDCLEVMKDIPDNSVDLTVTSPPYDNLRDYKGYLFDFEGIAKELYRIIKNGGVAVWVVGDATINGSETGTSFKQALYFKKIGFNLHDTMIYLKDGISHPEEKRYHQVFEYMFVFSKGPPKTFNPIQKENNYYGIKRGTMRRVTGETIPQEYELLKSGNLFNVWYYLVGYMKSSRDDLAFEHPAIFPERLAQDHINSWSNVGDIILDPMCGSGTTCKMAKQLNRRYTGIEKSPRYCKIAENRLANTDPLFHQEGIDQKELFKT